MLTKCRASAWFYVELYSASHGCDWHPIVVKTAVMVGIHRDFGSHV